MTSDSLYQQVRAQLAHLRLSAAAEALPQQLDEARAKKLGHTEFLDQLLAVEVEATDRRRKESLERFARLPVPWRLDDFDFAAQPSVDQAMVRELATLRFIDDATNVLLIGPPGVGKTMLAVGLARASIDAGYRTYYTTALRDVIAQRSKGGGRRRCGSSQALACWSSTRSATCRSPLRQRPRSSR
jgi:DNA replication protein DnaC